MPLHGFADESQGPPYLMAAVIVDDANLATVRAAVRTWRHRGSTRFHASRESNKTRLMALTSLRDQGVQLAVVELNHWAKPRDRRARVVSTVARVAARAGVSRLVLEDAESERARDIEVMQRALGGMQATRMDVLHARPSSEPLLWAADLVAWAYARGGEWKRRLPGLGVIEVP